MLAVGADEVESLHSALAEAKKEADASKERVRREGRRSEAVRRL